MSTISQRSKQQRRFKKQSLRTARPWGHLEESGVRSLGRRYFEEGRGESDLQI